MKKYFLLLILAIGIQYTQAQVAYEHISHISIYQFLDELANDKIIDLNTTFKPYSRKLIYEKLIQAKQYQAQLNARQLKELKRFLAAYNIEADSLYKEPLLNLMNRKNENAQFNFSTSSLKFTDSFFRLYVRPVYGYQYWRNSNGANSHRWNGAEAFAYMGKLGIYANLRDNHDELRLSNTEFLDPQPGAVYKGTNDYSEMRGGITYNWKWGEIALAKDHMRWGNHYHYPSIISEKAPSFVQLKYKLKPTKWFELNYYHAKLVSSVVDSMGSYSFSNAYDSANYREVFRDKYMASGAMTFYIYRRNTITIGNSVIYGDGGIEPAFLIPIMLYKSVDHTLIAQGTQIGSNNRGQNGQLYLDVSIRGIKHLHLYGTLFFDDLSFNKMKLDDHYNLFSLNAGFQISNLIPNTFFTLEYFRSTPLTYQHDFPTTTYESNLYNMGHYLVDNANQIYLAIETRPIKGLSLKGEFKKLEHGPDHDELGTTPRDQIPYMTSVEYKEQSLAVMIRYELQYNTFIKAGLQYLTTEGDADKYLNPYYFNTDNQMITYTFSLNYGF